MARRDRFGRVPEDKFVSGAFSLMDFISLHRTVLAVAIALIAVAGLGLLAYLNHIRSFNESALSAFEASRTTEDYRKVADSYPGSSVHPLALFSLGRRYLDEKKYSDASSSFSLFVRSFPGHPLAPNALLLEGMIFEQSENYDDAVGRYGTVVERYPDSYPAAMALFAMGRCLEMRGRAEEAKAAYEKIIALYPDSGWREDAEKRLGKAVSAKRDDRTPN